MPLQLFQPDPVHKTTLRETFIEHLLPRLQRARRAAGTIAKYWKAIQHWESFTDDPEITEVSSQLLDAFPEDLVRSRRLRTNTAANQQLTLVRAILASVLDRVPRSQKLPREARSRIRRKIPGEHLQELYRSCRFATWSTDQRIPAPLLWRSVLALMLAAPCRRCEGLLMPASAWHRGEQYPVIDEEDQFRELESPHGWLVFHTPKTARLKNSRPQVLPVTSWLAWHLEELDRLAPQRTRLLPVGNTPTTWRKQFNNIQRSSNLPLDRMATLYTFQELRVTANGLYRRLAGREVAEFMLGHCARGVNANWYDDLTEDAVSAAARLTDPFKEESHAGTQQETRRTDPHRSEHLDHRDRDRTQ